MIQAIAFSSANKAQATNDFGHTIIVQERYQGVAETWLHIWEMIREETNQTDLVWGKYHLLKSVYSVDPLESYWQPIK